VGFALKNDLAKFRRRLAPTLAASPCLDLQPRLAARLASGSSGNGAKRPRVAASPPGLRACVGLALGLALDKAEQVSQSRWVNAGAKANQLALVGVWALARARALSACCVLCSRIVCCVPSFRCLMAKCSNWAARPLSPAQLTYAAGDAAVLLRLLAHLERSPMRPPEL
jgi:hypothetical protein